MVEVSNAWLFMNLLSEIIPVDSYDK